MRRRIALVLLGLFCASGFTLAQVLEIDQGEVWGELVTDSGAPDGRLVSLSTRTSQHRLTIQVVSALPHAVTYEVTGFYESAMVRHVVDPAGNRRIYIGVSGFGKAIVSVDPNTGFGLLYTTIADCNGLADSHLFQAILDHDDRIDDHLPSWEILDAGTEELALVESYIMVTRVLEALPGLLGCGYHDMRSGFCSMSGDFESCISCCISEDSLTDGLITVVAIAATLIAPEFGAGIGAVGGAIATSTSAQGCINSYCEGQGGDPTLQPCGVEGYCAQFVPLGCFGEPDPMCPPPLLCWCDDAAADDEVDEFCEEFPDQPCCVDPSSVFCPT